MREGGREVSERDVARQCGLHQAKSELWHADGRSHLVVGSSWRRSSGSNVFSDVLTWILIFTKPKIGKTNGLKELLDISLSELGK